MVAANSSTTQRAFTGRIKTIPSEGKGGYCFIDLRSVLTEAGKEADIGTKVDIYLHRDQCPSGIKFEVGAEFVFDIEPDARRAGAFRASWAKQVIVSPSIPLGQEAVPGLALVLTGAARHSMVPHAKSRLPVHAHMKAIPAEQIEQAVKNEPLKGVSRDVETRPIMVESQEQMIAMLETYLQSQYPNLASAGITYQLNGYDEATQDKLIADLIQSYGSMGMNDQIQLTSNDYAGFKETRKLLKWLIDENLLGLGGKLSPGIVQTIVRLSESIKIATAKAKLVADLREISKFMIERNLLQTSTVLPMSLLPDIFLAAPVWFNASLKNIDDAWRQSDPATHPFSNYICSQVDNARWHDLFLLFNRRVRPMTRYKGDIIPPSIMRLLKEAPAVFDHVVVMTPYHEQAGLDWEDLNWLRSIDPYVVGFKEGIPMMFVIGRFSDTGVFPLLEELVADTINFLQNNKEKINNFNKVRNPYWYPGCGGENKGTQLLGQVNELLKAYERGTVFDWIRGEEKTVPSLAQTTERVKNFVREATQPQAAPTVLMGDEKPKGVWSWLNKQIF